MGVRQSSHVITIDGPSGTGKGTLCAKLAEYLGWHMLDSGAIYRLLALSVQEKKIEVKDVQSIKTAADALDFRFEPGGAVWLGEQEVSLAIRQEACGQLASQISVYPEVRQALLERQRAFLKMPGLVTDGRDMGTVVFPDAGLKFYLIASQEVRAHRRYLQLKAQGICVTLAQVLSELASRDERDSSRAHAPLMPAKDAVVIDTTDLKASEVLEEMLAVVKARGILDGGKDRHS